LYKLLPPHSHCILPKSEDIFDTFPTLRRSRVKHQRRQPHPWRFAILFNIFRASLRGVGGAAYRTGSCMCSGDVTTKMQQNGRGKVKEFETFPSSRMLFQKQRQPVMKRIDEFQANSSEVYARAAGIKDLVALGIKSDTAEQILPQNPDIFGYYTLQQHLSSYLRDLDGLDVDTFGDRLLSTEETGLQLRSYLRDFFSSVKETSGLSPATWFYNYCDTLLSRSLNVTPVDAQIDIVFKTTPPSGARVRPVPGIRKIKPGEGHRHTSILQELSIQGNRHDIWYHGTSLEYAEQIISTGILIAEGHKKQDFGGRTSGFYLSRNWYRASKRAEDRYPGLAGAVVIYHVNFEELLSMQDALDLSTDGKRWRNVVRGSRRGEETEADSASFVFGPAASSFTKEQEYGPAWIPKPTEPRFDQLALKTQRLASYFDARVVGIVVLVGPEKPIDKHPNYANDK